MLVCSHIFMTTCLVLTFLSVVNLKNGFYKVFTVIHPLKNLNILSLWWVGFGAGVWRGFSKGWLPCLHRVVLPSKKCHPGGIGCQIEQCLMWFKYWPISCPWMNSSQLSLGLDSLTLPFWSIEFGGSNIKFVIPLWNCFYFLLRLTYFSA